MSLDEDLVSTDEDSIPSYFEKCVYQTYRVTIPFIFALVVLVGIMGNILVIYVIMSRNRLRNVTNLLLANLAIADVSFLFICGTFTTVHYALESWPLSDILCRIIQYLLYTTCYVTVYTLIAVSAVRFIIIIYGANHRFIRSKRNVIILIITIWIVILFAKVPILIVHGVSYNPITNRTECIVSGKTTGQELFASFFVFAYALPLAIIATLYLMIVCHLRKKQDENLHENGLVSRRMGHVTKVVILVVAVFAVCWLPLHMSWWHTMAISLLIRHTVCCSSFGTVWLLLILFSIPLFTIFSPKISDRHLERQSTAQESRLTLLTFELHLSSRS